ncbi:MAG TPA: lysophospholipid acyltransferase family protein [Gaiellaceae bacterium]|nr:lysophospholipid acyltransferase family protein [Gaiellaceae bacterium]
MARRSGTAYRVVRRLARLLVRLLYRLQVEGAERLPPRGSLIVVANHESVLDAVVLGAALGRELRFLTKAELWRIPLLGRVLDALGGIAVERGRGDLAALARARDALEAGEAVALFPQGFVRREGPWQRGAARLALATGAPLVPVRLVGTAHALARGRIGLPRLRVVVGAPIAVAPGPATVAAARELTARVRAAVDAL